MAASEAKAIVSPLGSVNRIPLFGHRSQGHFPFRLFFLMPGRELDVILYYVGTIV